PTQPGNRWSVIPASQQRAALAALTAHCHTPEDLTKHQYLLQPYGPADLEALRKCKHCGGIQKKIQTSAITKCTYHPGQRKPYRIDKDRAYTCCGETGRGCTSRPEHDYLPPDRWLVTKFQEYASTPACSHTRKRPAVTLDCEMAGVVGNVGQVVVLLCAADYLTGETIINKLVQPTSRVVDWRTRVSGVTKQTMADAIACGEALAGWREAREELWKYVDEDTVLIGHSLQNDLDVLKVIHANVVDSAILARNAVNSGGRLWGLKGLCEELLGVDVQTNGMRGHDCLEDVMATREVVLCCTREPGKLQGWAEEARAREEALKVQREIERLEKKKQAEREKVERERKERKQRQRAEEYSEDEVVLWSDIAEDLGWPHPNTGYDPWSD
ncbi:hypothetical protein K440DRAFT_487289, partial [Wilcoxina mikolae CBS 423.85]